MSVRWIAIPLCIAGCLSAPTANAGNAPTQSRLLAGNGAASQQFGQAVDLDGDVAVIGSTLATPIVPVRVFERSAGVWLETATLTPSDGAVGAVFGYDVAVSGQTIVVSAPERARRAGHVEQAARCRQQARQRSGEARRAARRQCQATLKAQKATWHRG